MHLSTALEDAAAASSCRSFPCVLRCTSAPSLAVTCAAEIDACRCRCWSSTCQTNWQGSQRTMSGSERMGAPAAAAAAAAGQTLTSASETLIWYRQHACAAGLMCSDSVLVYDGMSRASL
jgi:hypothetical protein